MIKERNIEYRLTSLSAQLPYKKLLKKPTLLEICLPIGKLTVNSMK